LIAQTELAQDKDNILNILMIQQDPGQDPGFAVQFIDHGSLTSESPNHPDASSGIGTGSPMQATEHDF